MQDFGLVQHGAVRPDFWSKQALQSIVDHVVHVVIRVFHAIIYGALGRLTKKGHFGYNTCIVNKKEPEMSKLTAYTLEIYKADRRRREGRRLVEKRDFERIQLGYVQAVARTYEDDGFETEIHETYVTRKNLVGGLEFTERYDTPRFCSPASESYWSM